MKGTASTTPSTAGQGPRVLTRMLEGAEGKLRKSPKTREGSDSVQLTAFPMSTARAKAEPFVDQEALIVTP